jgi:hypothetical protein
MGVCVVGLVCSLANAQDLTVVSGGSSPYSIFYAPGSPSTVAEAATELRDYVQKATGVTLPIVVQSSAPSGPYISLGDNTAAAAQGLASSALPMEGYQITTRGQNLYILGPDIANTSGGGSSAGTRNGVYTFLEEQVGVRWLMPGEVGEDVPSLSTLTVPQINQTDQPGFANRRLPYVQNGNDDVDLWLQRQKMGYSEYLKHGHNWQNVVPTSLYDEHPDWFAMLDGERPRPVGDRYKIETTNPEVIQYYANKAIAAFDANPNLDAFSLSPTDSAGWSESAASEALKETDPNGELSVTPLVLEFYNDVAEIVGQVHPDRKLCGYIYSEYFYPPNGGIGALEPNLYLVTAPSIDYGYQLFRTDTQQTWENVLGQWAGATDNIAYYDLPTTTRPVANPPAVGLDILNFIYPRLADHDYMGVYVYGADAWGNGANMNYLLAKLAWDPDSDVYSTADEFYTRAYGAAAGAKMGQLYDELDGWMAAYYQTRPSATYPLTDDILRRVYGDHYGRLEELYVQAANQPMTQQQQTRLELFGDNLAVLQWYLRWRNMVTANPGSPLYRTDAQIADMLNDPNNLLTLAMAADYQSYVPPGFENASAHRWPADSISTAQPVDTWTVRGGSSYLIVPQEDGQTRITCNYYRRGEMFLNRYTVRDENGQVIADGFMNSGGTIEFDGQAGKTYQVDIDAESARYRLDLSEVDFLLGADPGSKGLHLIGLPTPLYFYVPGTMDDFDIRLYTASPGETALADIIDPGGNVITTLDTTSQSTDEQTIDVSNGGFWKILFRQAPSGYFDDVYIKLDDSLDQWFIVDPSRPLSLEQPPGAPGDVNGDGTLSAADIDLLYDNRSGSGNPASHPRYDLDGDGDADRDDVTYLVEVLLGTRYGDANLDGQVDEADLAYLADGWKQFVGQDLYGWATGDFSGSGDIYEADLALLANNWKQPTPKAAAVPEPASVGLMGVSGAALLRLMKRG